MKERVSHGQLIHELPALPKREHEITVQPTKATCTLHKMDLTAKTFKEEKNKKDLVMVDSQK